MALYRVVGGPRTLHCLAIPEGVFRGILRNPGSRDLIQEVLNRSSEPVFSPVWRVYPIEETSEQVFFRDVVACQGYFFPIHRDRYLQSWGVSAAPNPLLVLRLQSTAGPPVSFLMNGHHRALAAAVRGDEAITAQVRRIGLMGDGFGRLLRLLKYNGEDVCL